MKKSKTHNPKKKKKKKRCLNYSNNRCTASVCEGIDSTLGLCEDTASGCRKLITPFQYASQTCENFRISKLSGIGMQLTNTATDPDRACQVACQDREISYRSGDKQIFSFLEKSLQIIDTYYGIYLIIVISTKMLFSQGY